MNKEKLTGYWEKVKEALGKVSKKIWILIAVALAALVAGVIIYNYTRPYAALIDGATSEEAYTVVSWLESQGVTNYRMQGSGTVLVPEAQAVSLKARLLQEQYSSANSDFSGYFEQVSALSTVRDRDAAWQVALMESMEATIRKFDGVRDADVNIQTGEDRGYILDTNNMVKASAGVLLTMENGKTLTTEQANAIRNYISHSVAGLDVNDVSIQDTNGNIYDSLGAAGSSASDTSALKLQLEQYWSNYYRVQLERVLESVYGKDHVRVSVTTTVELGDKTINDYEVRLPEFAQDGSTNGAGILGNRFYAYEIVTDDETAAGGVVGTATNAQIPDYVESGQTAAQLQGILQGQGNDEYDNSKTQTYMVIHCGTLTDIHVGVSIDSTTAGPVNISDVREFVAATLGIQPDLDMTELTTEQYELQKAEYLSQKIGVLNSPFYVEPETPPEPTWVDRLESMGIPAWVVFAAIGGLVLFLVVLITIILLVRRHKKKKQAAEQQAVNELLATAMPGQTTVIMGEDGRPITVTIGEDGKPIPVEDQVELDENGNPVSGADVMDLHTERSMELRQQIRDFVDENMEVAALLIKSWMKEGGENG